MPILVLFVCVHDRSQESAGGAEDGEEYPRELHVTLEAHFLHDIVLSRKTVSLAITYVKCDKEHTMIQRYSFHISFANNRHDISHISTHNTWYIPCK